MHHSPSVQFRLVYAPKERPPSLEGEARLRLDDLRHDIRQARKDAGLTQTGMAELLGCSQSKYQKIEKGPSRILPDELQRILQLLAVTPQTIDRLCHEARELEALRRRCCTRDGSPNWFQEFSELEQVATNIFAWQGNRLPGLLQAEQYMWKQFSTGNQVNDAIALYWARKKRQEAFDQPTLVSYKAVLSEESLLRMPGGANRAIAREQVEHVLTLVETYPNVSIQVLPLDARLASLPPGFTIMTFPAHPQTRAFVETPADIQRYTGPVDLKPFIDDWHTLVSASLTTHETQDFLRARVAELHPEAAAQ